MGRTEEYADVVGSGGISRRAFLKTAVAAGLLAGCSPDQQGASTLDTTPAPTSGPIPAAPGRVVRARHAEVWDGDALVPDALGQMLDASVLTLTGLEDAPGAWAALFQPEERIAIKVNSIRGSHVWTHVPLVVAVAERLQQAGIPPEQITIFDRRTAELNRAGFPINPNGPGIRCYGTEGAYTAGWELMDTKIRLSEIVLDCDALINVPVLKSHTISGITFGLKNHYGTFDRPSRFHGERISQALGELNALEPIRERTRLIIGDALVVVEPGWASTVPGDSILASFDPVALDAIGLDIFVTAMGQDSPGAKSAISRAAPWLEHAAGLGLGTDDREQIDLIALDVG